jgi:RimJ/RimL family protein N-acetyltransferase
MFVKEIICSDGVRLIEPNVERDVELSVKWLSWASGRESLSMLNTKSDGKPSVDLETERIEGFINRQDQINWMIEHNGEVVGAIWVDLKPSEVIEAPIACLMIGEKESRGKGVGTIATQAVVDWLKGQGEKVVYSQRVLLKNERSLQMLAKLGFEKFGEPFRDDNGELCQNFKKDL